MSVDHLHIDYCDYLCMGVIVVMYTSTAADRKHTVGHSILDDYICASCQTRTPALPAADQGNTATAADGGVAKRRATYSCTWYPQDKSQDLEQNDTQNCIAF
jgi:hypothetical protein